jgi:hypothetical protein
MAPIPTTRGKSGGIVCQRPRELFIEPDHAPIYSHRCVEVARREFSLESTPPSWVAWRRLDTDDPNLYNIREGLVVIAANYCIGCIGDAFSFVETMSDAVRTCQLHATGC